MYTSTDSSFTPLVLCGHALHTHPSLIDVFVGSYYEGVLVNECGHNLNDLPRPPSRTKFTNVPCKFEREGGGGGGILCIFVHFATCNLVSTFSPPPPPPPLSPQVLRLLGPTDMTLWAGSPQELFVATNPSQQPPVSVQQLPITSADTHSCVDPKLTVVLMSCSCVLSAAESQRSTGQDQLNQHPRSEENVVEERLSYKLSKTSVVPSGCRICGTLRSKIHMLGEVMDQVHEERIKDDASMMEDKLPLLGQLPASVSDALYPGIVFSTLSASVRVTSAGATIDRLHDMGIAISVPEGAVSSGESFDLLIRPCLCGPFQLPRKFLSSSSAYLIRHGGKSTFQKDLLIKIHHYACLRSEEDCDSMTFLSASSIPQKSSKGHIYHTV